MIHKEYDDATYRCSTCHKRKQSQQQVDECVAEHSRPKRDLFIRVSFMNRLEEVCEDPGLLDNTHIREHIYLRDHCTAEQQLSAFANTIVDKNSLSLSRYFAAKSVYRVVAAVRASGFSSDFLSVIIDSPFANNQHVLCEQAGHLSKNVKACSIRNVHFNQLWPSRCNAMEIDDLISCGCPHVQQVLRSLMTDPHTHFTSACQGFSPATIIDAADHVLVSPYSSKKPSLVQKLENFKNTKIVEHGMLD